MGLSVPTLNRTHIDGAKALIRDGIDETVDGWRRGLGVGRWCTAGSGRLCERPVLRQTQTAIDVITGTHWPDGDAMRGCLSSHHPLQAVMHGPITATCDD